MKELKCPHCGNVFTVDESDYAALLGQVKNAEFESELARRVHELEQNQQARVQAQQAADKAQMAAEKAQTQLQLQTLQAQLQQAEQQKQLAVAQVRQRATEEYMKKDHSFASSPKTLPAQMTGTKPRTRNSRATHTIASTIAHRLTSFAFISPPPCGQGAPACSPCRSA